MTVVKRTFASSPARDAQATWVAIIDLLTGGQDGANRDELMGVAGVAASIIADAAPEKAPIVVTCEGPRTRIYCIYDDDAVDGSDANEDALGFDPLQGTWAVSLPCHADDLDWVKAALAKQSEKVTARDAETGFAIAEEDKAAKSEGLVFNPAGFLGS
ncbi:MAG TPA: hypothetical protein VEW71_07700 [Allosphingosinicella sp.]|nr:hypothetical protein [Allosphingosinicella sp.]